MKTYQKSLLATIIATSLAACGGSDSETPAPVNQAPVLTVSNQSVKEASPVKIVATATDSDGTIASYHWVQKSGTKVTLAGQNSATLSFDAPAVTADEKLVFSLTVTDNQGTTATKDVEVTVTANMLSLTVKGKITDNPVADAKVAVEVAGTRVEVVADGAGDYTAEITVDDSFGGEVVKITGVGPEANSQTKLISLLGDVASLVESAGDDKVLTKEETFAVNVTNVTTAVHALMKEANGGVEVGSKAAFDAAQQSYDASLVMPLATAIKLVLDYSEQHPDLGLPEGVSNVAELVADLSVASEYLSKAESNHGDVHAEAQGAIVDDPEVVAGSSDTAQIPGSYYFVPQEGFKSADRLIFAPDGSGEFIGFSSDSAFSWSDTDEGTLVTYPGKGMLDTRFEEGPDGQFIEVAVYRISSLVKWLQNSDKSAQLLIKHFNIKSYPDSQLPDVTEFEFESVAAIKQAGLAATELLKVGTTYSLSIPMQPITVEKAHPMAADSSMSSQTTVSLTVGENNNASLIEKRYFGDGTEAEITSAANYSVTESGTLKIQSNDSESLSLDVALLDVATPTKVNVMSNTRTGGGVLLEKGLVKWSAEDVAGIYSSGFIFLAPLEYFWFELNADGTAINVSTDDYNGDQQLSPDEISVSRKLWKLDDSGRVVIRSYRGTCNPLELQWETTLDDTCRLSDERIWELHSIIDQRHHVTQSRQYYLDRYGLPVLGDVPVDKHVLDYLFVDNRSWLKVNERPVALPAEYGVQSVNPRAMTFSGVAATPPTVNVPWRWDGQMSLITAERLAAQAAADSN